MVQGSELLHLDHDAAVLGRGVEDVLGVAVGHGLDVVAVGAELLEERLDSVDTLLGELLVALGGTRLLVGGTGEQELGGVVHDVVREVLEVSLLTLGDLGGAEVEVDGSRGGDLRFDGGEATILEQIGLAVDQVLERSELVLQVGDLVLELGVLLLEKGTGTMTGMTELRRSKPVRPRLNCRPRVAVGKPTQL